MQASFSTVQALAAAHLDEGVRIGYPAGRGQAAELELGAGAHVRSGSVIYSGSVIGARLQTGHNTVIREENVLGDDVSVWSNSVVDYGCRIGDRVKIHTNCYVAQFSVLEDDAFLAPGVSFANDLYPGDAESARLMRGPHVGAGAQLGVNTTVLPFVRIGAGAIIGAGSVVTRDIPAGAVAYGSPARVVGWVDDLAPISDRVPTADVCDDHGGRR
jgi:acetyltransferase-like isoleucine patch superfamily enzyme